MITPVTIATVFVFNAMSAAIMATSNKKTKEGAQNTNETAKKGTTTTAGDDRSSTPVKKSPRESNFGKGKYKGVIRSPGKKLFDARNRLVIEGLHNNMTVMMVYKAAQDHEAFLNYDYQMARENEEYQLRAGISLFGPYLKGEDGRTPVTQNDTSTWGFRIAVACGPNDTEEKRKELAQPWLEELNRNANADHYRYPRQTRFAGDKTPEIKRKASEVLLDDAVVALMIADSGDAPIREIMEDEEFMSRFWDNVDDGRMIMEEIANGMEATNTMQHDNTNDESAYPQANAPNFNP